MSKQTDKLCENLAATIRSAYWSADGQSGFSANGIDGLSDILKALVETLRLEIRVEVLEDSKRQK